LALFGSLLVALTGNISSSVSSLPDILSPSSLSICRRVLLRGDCHKFLLRFSSSSLDESTFVREMKVFLVLFLSMVFDPLMLFFLLHGSLFLIASVLTVCLSSSSVLDAALSAKPNRAATWVLRTETLQLGRLPPLDGVAVSVSLPLDMLPYRLLLRLPAPLK